MSRQSSIVIKMREMILDGRLAPGQRVAEIPLAEQLGVSRTPIRYALGVLAGEGLVLAADKRGYIVREFTLKDIHDAIELRGVLEGMAARTLAEAGLSPGLVIAMKDYIDQGQKVIASGWIDQMSWADMNEGFHGLIVSNSGNKALKDAIDQVEKLPFASARSYFGDASDETIRRQQFENLRISQFQHEAVLDALQNGQGARADALMREHARQTASNIMLYYSRIQQFATPAANTNEDMNLLAVMPRGLAGR
jgi:GntR family transcriptional regulator of vanillate catabolism